jgi:hypothetical protein
MSWSTLRANRMRYTERPGARATRLRFESSGLDSTRHPRPPVEIRAIFELADDECTALTPPVAGRGVLVSGHERSIVQVTPSPILWPFVASGETEDAA